MPAKPTEFAAGAAPTIRGEVAGEGTPLILCHGITATRRSVLHGSRRLERAGHKVIAYDARGHGESDPAPLEQDYGYPRLVADLKSVVGAEAGGGPAVLLGHSMGAHTAVALALREPDLVTALVVIGPAYDGIVDEESLRYWDGLAEALQDSGIEGFVSYIDRVQGIAPGWRDSVVRFTRERMERHRHLDAVIQALREVPRSRPFASIDELEELAMPTLVVASHDEADPGHPYAVARKYAERIPNARLVSESEGQSPLAWQGGRLSREIETFCRELQ
jgi:pimeloyl-ACP methyl ester carboxylesterase